MSKDLRLSLENPTWRKTVLADARKYKSKGVLQKYIEFNAFNPKVTGFIEANV